MTDDYAPFPEVALSGLASSLAAEATYYRDRGDLKEESHWSDGASVCRNALLSFAALRERCLIAEMENAQLKRRLAEQS